PYSFFFIPGITKSHLLFQDPPAFSFSHEDECIPYEIHAKLLSNKTKHHIRTFCCELKAAEIQKENFMPMKELPKGFIQS
uniref:Uncharacterized protein n=1 Tax=Zonotrichia albicollis TaxID=44394 RepID=A0A8D2QCE2_ZONAL